MSLDDASTLQQRFQNARDLLHVLFPRWKLGRSYSGFAQALGHFTPQMQAALVQQLRGVLQEWHEHWRVYGWVVLAVDGSRFECPRTEANEKDLGCAGREKTTPQLFQTTILHVGTGLPWDVRIGPGTDSERRHLDQMLAELPERTLLVADAGFISYALCRWLLEHQLAFLLRVGSNVQLLTDLGFACEIAGSTVYLWPEKQRDKPPIALRLIVLAEPGKQPVYLVTHLSEAELPQAAAAAIYRERWGIELYYRTIKQTLGHHRLLSRTPRSALLEQTWAFLGTWLLQLMTSKELVACRTAPRRWSSSKARNVIRRAMRQALNPRNHRHAPSLAQQLAGAVIDAYTRHGPKQTRNWPRKKNDQPAGPPKIRSATLKERQRAATFTTTTQLRL